MASATSPFNLVQLVQTLEEQHQQHAQAMDAVGATLAQQQGDHSEAMKVIGATLAQQQRQHAEATAAISGTLDQISGMLASLLGTAATARVAIPRSVPSGKDEKKPAPGRSAVVSKEGVTRPSRQSSFPTSGTESVLAFIREHTNPTTAELSQQWKSEGRGGKVDKVLGTLVKGKKLKRTAIDGARGSRYSLV